MGGGACLWSAWCLCPGIGTLPLEAQVLNDSVPNVYYCDIDVSAPDARGCSGYWRGGHQETSWVQSREYMSQRESVADHQRASVAS